ncbi:MULTISPECIES: cation diffusion facilitator family transporter [Myxococcus]|uniref:Cation transporter n=1 Tax=Myxococcus xanthus TaxID=34 RepID=A0AAE6FZZ3_MYXXA|nr:MULTISPECIES: cation diffusion facilitator family transporter [Myxococcus]QDE68465.1 cation transporter [Myxococcus xanthus]QDE75742.1 cation transporter [Myxococcus xanthus]QDE83070.1 cation transporter [Myxococcus xanthus]QDE97313.1 cation transporter [Myxococcus xanthus]QDF04879.1 cation transporter [Myxococcus xanthus]
MTTSPYTRGESGHGHEHDHGDGHGHHHHHGHGHGHGHGPRKGGLAEERKKDKRRLIFALVLTATIALAEAVGGWLTNSLALMSDAGHMLTDVSALALSLVALWFAGKPADVKKTYGYYRMEILSALLNGVLLMGITGFILYEAWERVRTPAPVDIGPMAIVASVGLLANLGALGFLHRSHSMNVRGAFLHVLGDTLSSVGVLVGAGIMAYTGWYVVDPIISVVISIVIVIGAVRLVRDAVDVLMEAVPAHVDLAQIKELMLRAQGVTAVHDLHVWTISSGVYALSAHLVVQDPMVCNNDEILSAVKHDLYDRFGIDHTTIQIESETYAHLGEVH